MNVLVADHLIPLETAGGEEYEEPRKKPDKPYWLKKSRCLCGSKRLKIIYGVEDGWDTPKKITCRKCGLTSEKMALSPDGVLNEWTKMCRQK